MLRRIQHFVIVVVLATLSSAQSQAPKPKLYIQAAPDAQAIKEEIAKKIAAWNGVTLVAKATDADLLLEVQQSGKLNVVSGSGDKGAAVLRDAHSGEDLWSDSRGGG